VSTDQLKGDSKYHVYKREGEAGRPHDHSQLLFVSHSGADETDGLEVSSTPLGADYPNGIIIAMNSSARNFLLYRWQQP
jgi:myo-inositol-hexaphosphate 3-phosphohydrolase